MKYHLRHAVPEVHIIFRSKFKYLNEPSLFFCPIILVLGRYIACTKGYLGVNIEFSREESVKRKMDSLKCRSPSIVKIFKNRSVKQFYVQKYAYTPAFIHGGRSVQKFYCYIKFIFVPPLWTSRTSCSLQTQ